MSIVRLGALVGLVGKPHLTSADEPDDIRAQYNELDMAHEIQHARIRGVRTGAKGHRQAQASTDSDGNVVWWGGDDPTGRATSKFHCG